MDWDVNYWVVSLLMMSIILDECEKYQPPLSWDFRPKKFDSYLIQLRVYFHLIICVTDSYDKIGTRTWDNLFYWETPSSQMPPFSFRKHVCLFFREKWWEGGLFIKNILLAEEPIKITNITNIHNIFIIIDMISC